MIPFKAEINGFKRYESTSVLLDKKLIAFVGTNEAGKSSFFDALLSIEKEGVAYELRELTKGIEFEQNHTVVRVGYLLNKEEKKLIKDWGGVGKPRLFCLEKDVAGRINHYVIGDVLRDKKIRKETVKKCRSILESKMLRRKIEKTDEINNDGTHDSLLESMSQLVFDEDWAVENLNDDLFERINNLSTELIEFIEEFSEIQSLKIKNLISAFDDLESFEKEERPS